MNSEQKEIKRLKALIRKLWKFSKHRAIANLIWITIMTPLAYFLLSGLSLLHAAKILGRLEIGIVLILILGFGAKHFIKKMLTTEAKIEAIAEKVDEKIK